MRTIMHILSAAVASAFLVGGATARAEDKIQLKDGTEVSGSLLQKDEQSVYIRVPRASVSSVNGQPLAPPVGPGAAAPAFTATDLSGATQSLADAQGQATLLQFWASWCPHCRADVPYMKDLFGRYRGKGLRVLTVSVDQEIEKLMTFLGKEQLPYPVISALAYKDLPDRYEMQGIPGYFLIDAKGVITKVWRGSLSEGEAKGKAELESLLTTLPKGT